MVYWSGSQIYLFVVGGYNSGGGDMITQEDTVFVSGMSPNLTEEDIEQHFGSIGVIKVSKKKNEIQIFKY